MTDSLNRLRMDDDNNAFRPDIVAIGARMRAARKEAELSLEAISEEMGLARATISAWETGRNAIRAADLGIYARIVGESYDSLISGADRPRLARQTEEWGLQLERLSQDERLRVIEFLEYTVARANRDKVDASWMRRSSESRRVNSQMSTMC